MFFHASKYECTRSCDLRAKHDSRRVIVPSGAVDDFGHHRLWFGTAGKHNLLGFGDSPIIGGTIAPAAFSCGPEPVTS